MIIDLSLDNNILTYDYRQLVGFSELCHNTYDMTASLPLQTIDFSGFFSAIKNVTGKF